MSNPRDPRVDPRKGDQIRRGDIHFKIFSDRTVLRDAEEGTNNQIKYQDCTGQHFCFLRTWRKWAAKAEVIHAAE